MRRNTGLVGVLVLFVIGLAACPASALTMGGAAIADALADSLLFTPAPNPALELYVKENSAAASDDEGQGFRLPEEKTSQDLIYYVSGVPVPMANLVLHKSNRVPAGMSSATEPVPDPAAGLLLFSGLGLLAAFKRRKCS